MNPEDTHKAQLESKFQNIHKVTPLSKYLAMILFVTLPFIGGWVGYTFTPEKVIEIEKVIYKSHQTEKVEGDNSSASHEPKPTLPTLAKEGDNQLNYFYSNDSSRYLDSSKYSEFEGFNIKPNFALVADFETLDLYTVPFELVKSDSSIILESVVPVNTGNLTKIDNNYIFLAFYIDPLGIFHSTVRLQSRI